MTTTETETIEFNDVQTFTVLGTPLLSEGRSQTLIGLASQLWLHAKVYANGGERQLHAHPNEDHAFFLLSGKARFENEAGDISELGPYEGIVVPRGVRYAFESIGEGNLVILRIGTGETKATKASGRPSVMSPTVKEEESARVQVPLGDQVFTGV